MRVSERGRALRTAPGAPASILLVVILRRACLATIACVADQISEQGVRVVVWFRARRDVVEELAVLDTPGRLARRRFVVRRWLLPGRIDVWPGTGCWPSEIRRVVVSKRLVRLGRRRRPGYRNLAGASRELAVARVAALRFW